MEPPPQDSLFTRIAPLLRLTRVSTAFAAVGNIWFVILWTRAIPEENAAAADHPATRPITQPDNPALPLAAATLTAVGIFAFATALNDTLDRKRDRALHPDRPIPSGAVSLETAVALVAFALLFAFTGAALLGNAAVILTLATAAAILVFHAALKHIPSLGLVLLSLIYASHMLIGNALLIFVWPVWLAMTHALATGAITHRLANRRPRLRAFPVTIAVLGWAFWSAALFTTSVLRTGNVWPDFVPPHAALLPAALFAAFFAFTRLKIKNAKTPEIAADKVHRYGALWMPLYAVAWCLGTIGHNDNTQLLPATLALAALAATGALGMTVLRELYSLAEHPVGFRR
jgi:4-hydroxybenzoate polyprenyltransferase